ncbi:MAG: AAA family ATPase [Planctomycetes bacterium]|nr:AAA family ATPase [Planctomycetota bacterium]
MLLGQSRPLAALRTGLELYAPGFNIFVSGLLGSGRLRIVHALLEELKPACRLGPDRAFVHNFREPNKPRLIVLPRGAAPKFRADMHELGRAIRDTLQQSLRSRWHRASRKLVMRGAEERRQRLFEALEREASRQGCSLVEYHENGELSADILPVVDGEVRSVEQLDELVESGVLEETRRDELVRAREELIERLEQASERTRRVYRETGRELQRVDRNMVERCLAGLFSEFAERWSGDDVRDHLQSLLREIVEAFSDWAEDHEGVDENEAARIASFASKRSAMLEVHVVSSDQGSDCPVIVESNPTYSNLFGIIEPASEHTPVLGRIHPGSLLRADGGYLIVRAADLFSEHGVWRHLQRALQSSSLEVREFDPTAGTTAGNLQPEPIPIDVKIVLIGEPGLYEALGEEDPHFPQLFKVHAEFDATVPNTVPNRRRYADFLKWIGEQEGLGAFDPQATAALVEFGARLSGRRTRLTTRFGDLADVAREASHLCRRAGDGKGVRREHVEQALEARIARGGLLRDAIEREFTEGYALLRTTGDAVGVVNAMTIVESHSASVGKPSRVTATIARAAPERTDVVSIEREAEMSGPLHDKGVMILSGFFHDRFGRNRSIGLRATICFEQLYSGLDGDSASCAELVALLSSLSGWPVRQDLAVTGSLNQLGDVQPVGGVNEKIEGFFALAQGGRRGGRRPGAIMPRVNVDDLMLHADVVEACSKGRFHIHAVERIEQVVELMFERPVGEVFARVSDALGELAD